MNSENLNRVADAIEKHEIEWLGFNMGDAVTKATDKCPDRSKHKCGTTACIGGHALILANEGVVPQVIYDWEDKASEFFGLNYREAGRLFYGNPADVRFTEVTPEQAVRTLRYAAKHGVIDWDAAQAEAG